MAKHNAAGRYLRGIQKEIPCESKRKKYIMNQIRETINEYLAENSDANYTDLVARFGTPRQIASSYVAEMEPPELLRKLKIRRKIICAVSAAMAVAVVLWIGVISIALIKHTNDDDGYYVERIVDVKSIPNENGGE